MNVQICLLFLHKTIDETTSFITCGFYDINGILHLPFVYAMRDKYLVESAKQLISEYTTLDNIADIVPSKFFDPYDGAKPRQLPAPIHVVYEVYLQQSLPQLEFLNYVQLSIAKPRISERHFRICRSMLLGLQGM